MRQGKRPPAPPVTRRPAGEQEDDAPAAGYVDLVVAEVFALVGATAALMLPEGDLLRIILVAPVALVVPGYLLIQAAVGRSTAKRRLVHLALGLGVSPVVLGLAALSMALIPGGFRTFTIVAAVTVVCLVSAAVAVYRRQASAEPDRPVEPPRLVRGQPAQPRRGGRP